MENNMPETTSTNTTENETLEIKKEKTVTEQRKHYKKLQYTFFGLEFISTLTPFVVIALVNFDKYFVTVDGYKMSIATWGGLALMGIATWLVAKKKFENSFVTLIIGWAACAFIFTMMGQLITDLATIMWFGLLGILGAFGCDIVSKNCKQKSDKIKEAMDQAIKENTTEAYKQELAKQKEKKTIKIKIKK